jgi:D-alanyl-D-alanine carboxypeptidase
MSLRFCRLLPALVLLIVWLGLPAPAAAAGNERYAAILIDANSGQIVHAENADEPRHPASLTKMMTLYIAFEAIERGRASFGTRIKISAQAAAAAPTKLGLDEGEDIALGDAIRALITKSANDMAVAIAEHFGGTEAQFAAMMTEKARALGMNGTYFRNASGLPDPAQITTARDMLTLALRLYDDFPRQYQLFSLRAFTYQGVTYKNHNTLLRRFAGTDGIKTGYTRMSGFNLVASVHRGGRHVMGVVLGGTTADRRDDAMQLLLSRALLNASPIRRRAPRPVMVAVRTAPPRIASSWAPVAEPVSAPHVVASVAPMAPVPPAPRLADRPQRGAPPSTLGAQAENLARGGAPIGGGPVAPAPIRTAGTRVAEASVSGAVPRLRGADLPAVAAVTSGAFEIQIGAFGSVAEAERMLSVTREKASDLLRAYQPRAIAVQKDNRQIFRARFAGFDASTAAATCQELRRRQVECLVTKAD